MTVAAQYVNDAGQVHPGLVFLLRASVKFDQVQRGDIDLDQALAELEPDITDLFPTAADPCPVCDGNNRARLECLYPLPSKRKAA